MKFLFHSTALLTACTSVSLAQITINEIRIDDPDADDFEYFEIFNGGRSAINLGSITYVVIGEGAGGSGVIQEARQLPAFSLDPGSHFLASQELTLRIDPDADGVANLTAAPNLEGPLRFENSGNVTHLLAVNFSGAVDDDLDTDDDGTLDVRPWVSVLDAVSLCTPGSDSQVYALTSGAGSPAKVGPDGSNLPAHLFRVPDGGPWIVGSLGREHDPGTGNLLQETQDTPGKVNPSVTPLRLTLSETSVSERAVNPALTGTVTRSGTSGQIEIVVTTDDPSEAIIPESVFILDGASAADFYIDVVNDLFPDGAQTVTVRAAGESFAAAERTFVVTDDGDFFSVVINEVYHANDPVSGDVNENGIVDSADHFIELVNVGEAPVDLSDYHLENRTGTASSPDGIYRFLPGTILEPGCALVIFGGAGANPGITEAFGTAEILIASTDGLSLSNTGDTLRLLNAAGQEVYSAELPDLSAGQTEGSLNLVSEGAAGDPTLGFDRHLNLAASDARFSPGTSVDGSAFCNVTDTLSITLLDANLLTPLTSIPENASPGSVVARIEAPNREAGEVVLFRIESALGELNPSGDGIGILNDANPTIDYLLDPVDNTLAQGSRTETISVRASSYLNNQVTIEVTDDGDLPPFTEVVINEIDADQTGQDTAEFVELYNLTGLDRTMDGLLLVLINGNGDSIYHVTDLAGFTLPAQGVFVVGASTVPNVDLTPEDWSLQNGADAVAIYQGSAADFPIGATITTLSNPVLIDAVVYGTNDGDDAGLLAALTPGQAQINEGEGGSSGTESIQRLPDGGNQLETSTFVTRLPTPGRLNSAGPPPEEELVDLEFDFAGNLLVATISGLRPETTYTVEASSDGGDMDPFVPVISFTTADRNVIDEGGTVFQVYIFDRFLADLAANPRQFYRLLKP